MKMETGKNYLVKKDIFSFKKGEICLLSNKGYQIYFGEHNFVFVNEEKQCKWMVLRDGSNEDMRIYCHLEEYFEEVNNTEA
ncbi:phosphohydrolase [Treponema putidum]|uniref:phosphohydrolase n=1 Tax=Treponema putidum TaxID=221027 RepID=UPI002105CE38|nr:phosphohydrolase [Treponema putidum]UTY32337.1 phosphohydrolase [Treponema putidum]